MRKIVAFVIVLGCFTGMKAQNLSNTGKEFWVGYGHHQFMEPGQNNSQEMVLYFSAEQEANVRVAVNGTGYVRNYKVPANSVIASELIPKNGANDCRLYSVPPSFGGTGGEGVFNRGIHITSDVPIVAYAHIYGSLSSGATMLMPVETWGYAYASVNSQQVYGNNNCFSWLFVVANEDNTVVEIIPSVRTRNGRTPNVPFTVTLNKGQIYQVVGAAVSSSVGYELTGSRVKSIANAEGKCYPIGVFAGSSRTAITCTGGSGSGDNIMQQILPFQAWGKRYLTAPTSNSSIASAFNTNIYRIAVKDPSAVVKRNGQVLTGLKNNFYYEFTSNAPDYIESDKPILVAQYIPSSGGCPSTSGVGDPEMMYISPVEQAIKRIAFYRNKEEEIDVNYLTLIIPTAGLTSLKIDGGNSYTQMPHPRLSGYSIVVKRWTAAKAQCIVQSDSAFTAITYGLGGVESYGYNAGTMINNLSAISSIHNVLDPSNPQHDFTCTNSPVEISVLMAYKPTWMQWLVSEAGTAISPQANYTDVAPVPSSTELINGVEYYKYTLPGSYKFTGTGTFKLPVLSRHPSVENCNNTERVVVEIVVKDKPLIDFNFSHEGCARDTVYLTAENQNSDGYSFGQWDWELPGNIKKQGKNLSYVLPPGTHDVKLNVVSSEGCVSDVVKPITVAPHPEAGFTATGGICLDQEATITDHSTIASGTIQSWHWDLGDGNRSTLSSGAAIIHKYDTYRSYPVSLVVVSDKGCESDTFRQNIIVHPLPVADFNLPVSVCMPEGRAAFVNRSTLPNTGALTYEWNFGDASAVSAARDPVHSYAASGPFNVSLKVTSSFGCTDDTVKVLDAFYEQPFVDFSVNTDTLCQGTESIFQDLSTSQGSNITSRNWIFGDGSTDQSGNPRKTYRLPGKYNVQLSVTNAAGCMADTTKEVVVYLQPVIDAGPSFVVPLGTLVRFNPKVNDSTSLQFQWTPASDFANANVLRPSLIAMRNETYFVTATGPGNCTAEDSLTVKILKPVTAPNAFSPNGDGINDTWVIQNLEDYRGAVVEVFNRYGQLVFRSSGNFRMWDGKFQGKYLPVATYYYVITLKNGYPAVTGSITIVK